MKVHDFREDDGSPVSLKQNERLWVDATGKGWRVERIKHPVEGGSTDVFNPLVRLAPLQAARDRRAMRMLWLGFALTLAAFALALYTTKVPHG